MDWGPIYADLWTDEKFEGGSFTLRSFFAFLLTNPYGMKDLSGLYRVSPEQLSVATDSTLTPHEVAEYLNECERRRLVMRDGRWLWIINRFARVENPANVRTQINVGRALLACRSPRLVAAWKYKYAAWVPRIEKALHQAIEVQGAPEEVDDVLGLRAIVPDPPPADDEPAVLYEDEIQAVWHFYMTTIVAALGRPVSYTLSAARRSLILTRLRDRIKDQETGETRLVTIEDLMAAISACAASDWHLGRSPDSDGTHYSLERDILRDKEQLERWLEGARGATRRRRAKARRGEPKLPPEPSEPEAREERL